jgi:hypothetical protein
MTYEERSSVDLVEAAARLRVPYHTAHRLVLTGRLNGRRLNGRWAVDPVDLDRLVGERGLANSDRRGAARPPSRSTLASHPTDPAALHAR